MKLARFVKSPIERKRYSIDYSSWLDSGELVQSIVFTVTPVGTGSMTVDSYLIGTPATSVNFFANYGVGGVGYTIDVRMTTSGGQIKEDTILFSIRSA